MPLLIDWDNTAQQADLVRDGGNFEADAGLQTAVMISLFSDAQPSAEDLPDVLAAGGTRRGWWADVYLPSPIGSRLWLVLEKGPIASAAADAIAASNDSLAWMVADGVAAAVSATARVVGNRLFLKPTIKKPDGGEWSREWEMPFAVA